MRTAFDPCFQQDQGMNMTMLYFRSGLPAAQQACICFHSVFPVLNNSIRQSLFFGIKQNRVFTRFTREPVCIKAYEIMMPPVYINTVVKVGKVDMTTAGI